MTRTLDTSHWKWSGDRRLRFACSSSIKCRDSVVSYLRCPCSQRALTHLHFHGSTELALRFGSLRSVGKQSQINSWLISGIAPKIEVKFAILDCGVTHATRTISLNGFIGGLTWCLRSPLHSAGWQFLLRLQCGSSSIESQAFRWPRFKQLNRGATNTDNINNQPTLFSHGFQKPTHNNELLKLCFPFHIPRMINPKVIKSN